MIGKRLQGAIFASTLLIGCIVSFAVLARDPSELAFPSNVRYGFSDSDLKSSKPIGVLVEFAMPPAAEKEATDIKAGKAWSDAFRESERAAVRKFQDRTLSLAEEAGIPAEIDRYTEVAASGKKISKPMRTDYLFNGARITIPGNRILKLLGVPGVVAVYEDRPRVVPVLNASTTYTQAPQVWSAGPPIGNRGAGQVIAIIDTGIDWYHPMFGDGTRVPGTAPLPAGPAEGCFGPAPLPSCAGRNQKVIYATGVNAPGNTPNEGPLDISGHGTHVASTAAGSTLIGVDQPSPKGHIEGTAPDALLMGYKVLGNVGSSFSVAFPSATIVAIDDASRSTNDHPKATVMNLSLGAISPNNAVDQASAVAVDNAVRVGVSMVVAVGNCGSTGNALCPSGREGAATISAPGTSRLAIGVGASNDPGNAAVVKVIGEPGPPTFSAVIVPGVAETNPFEAPIQAQYVNCGGATTPGSCGPQASGKIGLIFMQQAAPGAFEQWKDNAEADGVIATVFVERKTSTQTGNEPFPGAMVQFDKPVLGITFNSGEAIKAYGFDANRVGNKVLRLELESSLFQNSTAGFTSTGPLSDFTIKPDVTAPGQNIYAAHSLACNSVCGTDGYAATSGTSMAAPHMAGLAAILRNAHPEWSPNDVKTAIMNTAAIIGPSDSDPNTAEVSVNEEGSGAGRVFDAARTPVLLTQPSFSFGEVVTPTSTVGVSYQRFRLRDVRSSPSGSQNYALSKIERTRLPQPEFKISFRNPSNLSQTVSSVTVPSGGHADFMLRVEVGPDLPESPKENPAVANDNFLIWEGYEFYIVATPSTGSNPTLSAPIHYRHVHVGSNRPLGKPVLQDPGENNNSGTYGLQWSSVDLAAGYRVEETTTFRHLFPPDTVEGNASPEADEIWKSNGGWTSSSARNHTPGGARAYFSGQGSNLQNRLVSEQLNNPSELRFWEWMDTERDFDFGQVIAVIGGEKRVIREQSGNSSGWREVKVSLPSGTTSLEFLYKSDDNIDILLHEGWYLDDIEILSADWKAIGEPSNNELTVKDRSSGTYFYRVAALRQVGGSGIETSGPSNVESISVNRAATIELAATGASSLATVVGMGLLLVALSLGFSLRRASGQ